MTALIVFVAIYGYLLITLGAGVLLLDNSAMIDPAGALVAARETTANLAGSFGDVIGEHLKALPLYGLSQISVQGPTTLAAPRPAAPAALSAHWPA
jgi:uncharacterized protein